MPKSIGTIKEEFLKAELESGISGLKDIIALYENDERKGVKNLIKSGMKKIDAYDQEKRRIDKMLIYERENADHGLIAGIDEAGRGPLAGPVVAAAVILDMNDPIFYVNDSKQLSEKKREELYDEIMKRAVSVGVGISDPAMIDRINILQADYVAMRQAVFNLNLQPGLLLNDAVRIPELDIPQVSLIKGDAKSLSIAAASIIAKVTRDRMMKQYDILYPDYGFAKNKGYGTADHIKALKEFGPCPIHRKTFIGNFVSVIL